MASANLEGHRYSCDQPRAAPFYSKSHSADSDRTITRSSRKTRRWHEKILAAPQPKSCYTFQPGRAVHHRLRKIGPTSKADLPKCVAAFALAFLCAIEHTAVAPLRQ